VAGCSAETRAQFAHFLSASVKAANATEHHLLSARDLGLINPDLWQKLTAETVEIRKMTYGYRRRVLEEDAHW
jgi:four helix bundle protein